jgi:hypothetical protein
MGAIIPVVIQELPAILAAFKDLFRNQHPGVPDPTDDEVMQAFEAAFQSSRAKDDAWLAAHPQ